MSADAQGTRRRGARPLLLVLASAVAFAAGAAADPAVRGRSRPLPPLAEEERAAIGAAIEAANAILQDLYATGGVPALLDELPYSTALRHQVFRDLGLLHDAGLTMVLDQADLVPLQVLRTGPDEAEALVFEEWNFMYQRAASREPVGPPRGLGQGFRYRLIRRAGAWQVAGWEPEDVPAPEVRGRAW